MADEAFALSPISARAALPGEEDYAAISEAFMETSRGRWFLGEYAKRNRNADTSMVLDAVARIEQSLAAQKEETLAVQREATNAQREAAAAVADNSLAEARLVEALIAIRGALEAAQTSAMGAIDGLALTEKLVPVRKGARVIREIAWRLREIGNDGRICDLIDSQVGVIEQGAEEISFEEARAALEIAFDSIAGRIAEFSDEEMSATVVEAQAAAPEPQDDVAQANTRFISPDALAPITDADAVLEEMETAELESAEAVELTAEAAEAHDEAVLDMIAMEMGAPDPEGDEIVEPVVEETHIAAPVVEEALFAEPPVEPEIVAELPEPMAAPIEPPVQTAPMPMAAATPEPALEVSLGSSLIASGLVRRPVAANDPLAPIRRMSQAEKIAFFS